jgi:tRNA(fMet)-specific endonuclease VapC
MILDTVVLIDLEREISRGKAGPATTALEQLASEELYLTSTVIGELAAGESMRKREVWSSFIQPFTILEITTDVCWNYGELYRVLRSKGAMIGANDMWIAAAAISYKQSLLSRNRSDFHKVPSLLLKTY